jgi:hypothetical protein
MQVAAQTTRLVEKARRKLPSSQISRYQRPVMPTGNSVLVQLSPNDPTSNNAIGAAR